MPITMRVVLVLATLLASTSGFGCIDNEGAPVAWWAAYKMPEGTDYAYRDANDGTTQPLVPASGKLDDENSPLTRTLDQITANDASMSFNDEYPDGTKKGNGAHAKGVVAARGSSGFWLVHSLPSFPDWEGKDYWDSASTIYGQTYMCLSLSATELTTVGLQFQYMQVHVYNYTNNAPSISTWGDVLDSQWKDGTHIASISAGSQQMTSFAKSPNWGEDLYEDLVEQQFKISDGWAWETWRRGGTFKSICPSSNAEYPVMDVLTLQCGPFSFKYTNDHSKWGVSLDTSKPYICIGGINRMISQEKRGGGTVCFESESLYNGFYQVIDTTTCDGIPPQLNASSAVYV